jgi:D-alanyl-D-alanine carboxypeptidase
MPGEDDGSAGATAEAETGSSGPNLLSPNILAFTGGSVNPAQRTVLGPRVPVKPVPVWIGMNPPTAEQLAAQAAEEQAAEEARKAKKSQKKAIAAKPKASKAAEASAPVEKGKAGRASVSLKPVSGADVVKDKPGTHTPVVPVKAKAAAAKPAPKAN